MALWGAGRNPECSLLPLYRSRISARTLAPPGMTGGDFSVQESRLTRHYAVLGASWGLFAAFLLVPDLSMIGYAWGPRVGAMAYNAVHTVLLPAALAAMALGGGGTLGLALALIAAAHIGMDRALGYGLKHPTGVHDTHLPGAGGEGAGVRGPATGR